MVSEVSFDGQLSPLVFSLWQSKNIKVEGHGRGKLLTSQWARSRERAAEEGVGDKIYPSEACL
jgi:hypothetical protein